MGDMLKCEDVILGFIKSHPDVTIVVEYDAVNESYVIGINSTRGGKFRKHKFVVNSKYSSNINREVYENLSFGYSTVMIADKSIV